MSSYESQKKAQKPMVVQRIVKISDVGDCKWPNANSQ